MFWFRSCAVGLRPSLLMPLPRFCLSKVVEEPHLFKFYVSLFPAPARATSEIGTGSTRRLIMRPAPEARTCNPLRPRRPSRETCRRTALHDGGSKRGGLPASKLSARVHALTRCGACAWLLRSSGHQPATRQASVLSPVAAGPTRCCAAPAAGCCQAVLEPAAAAGGSANSK